MVTVNSARVSNIIDPQMAEKARESKKIELFKLVQVSCKPLWEPLVGTEVQCNRKANYLCEPVHNLYAVSVLR